ncbi:MAG: ATP-binding cassette domain-containing protein [Collinsella stercoris]|uniref:ABC transporter ATP-binding protein n=1 Tax=Collinsella stercoris TaxID=147206 RepID=UPI002979CFB8|nr:ABC transporter ATP-binding protein [Collinsella stercoris]MEE0612415.1 ABC transporter ATP-binding protein [Collinsella stercoris]
MDVIAIEGLVKRYDELLALDHFDLHVDQGEIFGLLGPNGSGKTTSINCMLTLLTYDRGSIRLFGESMAPTRYDLKRRIGIVPQQVAVIDELTVRENIDYFCSLYVNDRARRRALVDEAIEFVELEEFVRFRPGKLSGGLLRRLNIACGIAHKPELIFFDEPTVAVDPQSRNAILNGIQRLRAEGATVVYTSHYMEEVEQICDRVMIMDHGRALAQGTPDELKRSIRTGERIVIELEGPSGPRARPGSRASDGGVLPTRELDRLRALPHVLDVSLAGNLLTVSCEASEHNLTDVLASLRAGNARLGRITCAPPTLNDVFLEITGRELRD